ncbi:MAG: transporter substrate-binding domain-containing protein [Magnetococcales bacterium]|nr:transporter substrate-binding domain-containing protein [Magnetococcales bacterium]
MNVFQDQGLSVDYQPKPFLRASNELHSGLVDTHMGTFATQWDGFIYSRWHYHLSKIAVLFKKNKVTKWNGYDTLAGKRIGWPKGYFFHVYFDKKIPIKLLEVIDMKQCIRLLQVDRLDFCMEGLITGLLPAISEFNVELNEFKTETVFLEPVYLRFQDTPRSRNIKALFDKRMDELYTTGKLEQIYQKLGLSPIFPEQSELAEHPLIEVEKFTNGTDEWAPFVEYLNH